MRLSAIWTEAKLEMTWIAACSGQRGIYQETIMTDEERQKLRAFIVDLRALEHDDKADLLEQMADEIERLMTENKKLREQRAAWEQTTRTALAQSDAEPVAWRYRWRVNAGVEWTKWREVNEIGAKYYFSLPDHEVQSLYTVPPSRSR
jgi:hypothetical protein